jgi:hypothetical protein
MSLRNRSRQGEQAGVRPAGWVAAIVVVVVALIAGSLQASSAVAGAASVSSSDAAADDYHPRDVPFEPVSSTPPEQPRPALPVGGIKSVSSDVTVDAQGGDVALDDVPASLRVAKGALPDDTHVHVEVLGDTVGTKLSPVGMAFAVKFTDGTSRAQVVPDGKVLIDVDYSQLVGHFGGDFLDRLRWWRSRSVDASRWRRAMRTQPSTPRARRTSR